MKEVYRSSRGGLVIGITGAPGAALLQQFFVET
jgi:hypothetical protein